MLTYSGRVLACFEHSNLFKVNEPELRSGLRLGRGGKKKRRGRPLLFLFSSPRSRKRNPGCTTPEGVARARSGRGRPVAFASPGEYSRSIKSRSERPVGGNARTSARPSGADRRRSDRGKKGRNPPSLGPVPRFNYELFNCNNFNIRYWSWNYRGCWHQTCPPIVPR
jgi:hypothetical protein